MADQQIIADILRYVGFENKANWYVGIAEDARKCLFSRHCVNEHSGSWIYATASTSAVARQTEIALHGSGFDGGPGGGSDATNKVYAYRKTPTTIQ